MAALVAVTLAPTIAAPLESVTVPFSDPRVCCDRPGNATISTARLNRKYRATLLRKFCFIYLLTDNWVFRECSFPAAGTGGVPASTAGKNAISLKCIQE